MKGVEGRIKQEVKVWGVKQVKSPRSSAEC